MKFEQGTVVKIKKGVSVNGVNFSIEGWHGRIGKSEYDDPKLIMIELDSVVLKNLPEDYILETLRHTDIDSFNNFYLYPEDVEPAQARDTLAEVEAILEHIENKYYWKAWSDGSPEEESIAEILCNDALDDDWHDWEAYFEKALKFPFEVRVTDGEPFSSIKLGDTFKVHSILDIDEHYGVIVRGRKGRQRFDYPLCDLEVSDEKSPNYLPVRAYQIWFANR